MIIAKEFFIRQGIYEKELFAIDKLSNFIEFIKSDESLKINPSRALKDLIIDACFYNSNNNYTNSNNGYDYTENEDEKKGGEEEADEQEDKYITENIFTNSNYYGVIKQNQSEGNLRSQKNNKNSNKQIDNNRIINNISNLNGNSMSRTNNNFHAFQQLNQNSNNYENFNAKQQQQKRSFSNLNINNNSTSDSNYNNNQIPFYQSAKTQNYSSTKHLNNNNSNFNNTNKSKNNFKKGNYNHNDTNNNLNHKSEKNVNLNTYTTNERTNACSYPILDEKSYKIEYNNPKVVIENLAPEIAKIKSLSINNNSTNNLNHLNNFKKSQLQNKEFNKSINNNNCISDSNFINNKIGKNFYEQISTSGQLLAKDVEQIKKKNKLLEYIVLQRSQNRLKLENEKKIFDLDFNSCKSAIGNFLNETGKTVKDEVYGSKNTFGECKGFKFESYEALDAANACVLPSLSSINLKKNLN